MHTRLRLLKNALANLVRGGSAGVVALVLPAVLARHMNQMHYSIWVLVLQVAAYSSYLDFGLQTAVGRYIAYCEESDDPQQRDAIFSTAFVGLGIAAAIALTALAVAAALAGSLFPRVPPALLPSMRLALLVVGGSIAIGLPSSAWSGVFIGMQRNELSAAVIAGSKLLSAAGLVVAALQSASLLTMSLVVAGVNLVSYAVLYLLVRRYSTVRFQGGLVRRGVARDLFQYCFSLTIWSFATLLINGLDIVLVGRFDLGALVPYALASSLTSIIAGFQSAVFNATMPHAAVLHARRDSAGLGRLVLSSTRLAVVLLFVTSLPVMLYGAPLFRLWVGQQYAPQGQRLLWMLMAANVVRFVGLPYSIVLVAAAQQRLVTLSPVLEGVTNLIASLVLGARFGAIGIAFGTLIGGVVGMLGHLLYNMPRTCVAVAFRVPTFLISSVAIPTLTAFPLLVLVAYSRSAPPMPYLFAGALLLTVGLAAFDLVRSGTVSSFRS